MAEDIKDPLESAAIPASKLDAEEYLAEDQDGLTESVVGTGNATCAFLQGQNIGAEGNLTRGSAISPGADQPDHGVAGSSGAASLSELAGEQDEYTADDGGDDAADDVDIDVEANVDVAGADVADVDVEVPLDPVEAVLGDIDVEVDAAIDDFAADQADELAIEVASDDGADAESEDGVLIASDDEAIADSGAGAGGSQGVGADLPDPAGVISEGLGGIVESSGDLSVAGLF